MQTVITGSGSFVPHIVKKNGEFIAQPFYDEKSRPLNLPSPEIVKKFESITGIQERRYADDSMTASCMAAFAGRAAIDDAGIDAETIDQVIVAHNFGDIDTRSMQSSMVPS